MPPTSPPLEVTWREPSPWSHYRRSARNTTLGRRDAGRAPSARLTHDLGRGRDVVTEEQTDALSRRVYTDGIPSVGLWARGYAINPPRRSNAAPHWFSIAIPWRALGGRAMVPSAVRRPSTQSMHASPSSYPKCWTTGCCPDLGRMSRRKQLGESARISVSTTSR